MGPQCGLGTSWSYTGKVSQRWEIVALFGHRKLYAIPPDLVAQHIKLDLSKHFHVPPSRSYEPDTSIFLVGTNGFYSLDKRPRDIREVREKERLITLLAWRHDDDADFWEPTHSNGHRFGPKFLGKLTGPTQRGLPEGWALLISPSSENIPVLGLGHGVKVVFVA